MLKCVKRYLAVNRAQPNWGQKLELQNVLDEVSKKKMVVFGEVHSKKYVVEFQHEIQQ